MENSEISQEDYEENRFRKPESSWKWDKWQEEVLNYEGNITIRSGRQVGKSVVVAEKVTRFALAHYGVVCLVVAASQRQSALLFEKIKSTLAVIARDVFAETPTQTKVVLKNGSQIYSLPVGKTGDFLRGYTLDLLIIDEAAYVPERCFNSILPMLAVSRKTRGFGHMIMLSTPYGKGGFYFESFSDKDFRAWHVSSEDCPRISKEFLAKEKKRLSRAQYAQEWKGEFAEETHQFFKSELVKSRMTLLDWNRSLKLPGSGFYLGLDVARYGGDENAFVIVELVGSNDQQVLKVVKVLTTENVSTVDTIGRVVEMNKEFDFKRIFIDDAGVGGGVTDVLQEKLGRKVIGLNNASKRVEVQGEEKKRGILKEDLYSNTLVLLENGKLELLYDDDLARSMRSVWFSYTTGGLNRVKFFGDYTHLTEALVRACWCVRERGLDVYCA